MSEIWKEFIEGYSVSNIGRIRNDVKGSFMVPQKRYKHSEHLSVHIKGKNYSVSREVAKAFVPNPDNHPIVRHFDGNQRNNYYTNLVWGTQKDNTEDALRHRTHTCLTSVGFAKQKNEANKPTKTLRIGSSGVKGVTVYEGKTKTKYRATISCEKIGHKYLGSFDTIEEAKEVYEKAHIELYGISPYLEE